MSYFSLALAASPIALSSILAPADPDMSHGHIVFFAIVGLAAIGWLLAMVGLAGGWGRVAPFMQRPGVVGILAAIVVLGTVGMLIVRISRPRTARAPTSPRVNEHEAVGRAVGKFPASKLSAPPDSPTKRAASSRVASPRKVRAKRPSSRRDTIPKPTAARAAQADVYAAKAKRSVEQAPVRRSDASLELPSKSAPGASALSETQAKRVCSAVSLFAGAQVYIKWSPGASAEALASRISQAMDCASVTVTYASETAGLEGQGVQIGTHANEGETSDRIRPFADAIAAALRAQGFNVSEVTGAGIPANQTAIFIGSD